MNLLKLVFALALLLLAAMQVLSQKTLNNNASNNILIDATKPAVYLDFVKTGKCTKDFSNFNAGDLCTSKASGVFAFDAFWLRFVNNTRWAIGVTVDKQATKFNSTFVPITSTESVNDKGEVEGVGVKLANNKVEMDVVYKAESQTGCDFSAKVPKGKVCRRRETTVPKIPLPGISSDLFVASGDSIIFPVNREHIKKYIDIYVVYNFEWEFSGERFSHSPHYELQHRVYFSWFDLERELKNRGKI